jgi:Tfp pilus assembly protein PilP
MKSRIIYLFLVTFLILNFGACKTELTTEKKPMAEKVKPVEIKIGTKESEEAYNVPKEEYFYESRGRRDPFMPLIVLTKQKTTRKKGHSPLESFGIEEISLIAIASDKEKYYALIMLPDKKTYTITEGMSLGLEGGKVDKITPDEVTITEYIKDYRGNLKPKVTELKLHKEEEE